MIGLRLFLGALLLASAAFAQFPKYDRSNWKHWTDADGDGFNTRQEVLIRDSLIPVTLAPTGKIMSGLWLCPYSGSVVTDPGKLDVDHMVALQNAYQSGGSAWGRTKKEAFANALSDPHHLLAVLATHNRSKGSKGPADWRPPSGTAWCEYGLAVARIKERWRLAIPPNEAIAIVEMVGTCSPRDWDLRR